ncbi:MAG TPA: hypothetical protein VFM49_27955, partial [Chloroflexia bacterium]|nr:hypothetical protein [Chloroflexia bacterium]
MERKQTPPSPPAPAAPHAARRLRVLLLPAWYPTRRYPVGGIFCQEQARALAGRDDLDGVVL